MKITCIMLSGRIRWRIHRNTPKIYTFQSLPNVGFINPALYSDINTQFHERYSNHLEHHFVINQNETIIESSYLYFVSEGDNHEVRESIFNFVPSFLVKLRHLSRQAELAKGIGALIIGKILKLPEMDLPILEEGSRSMVRAYLVDTAVSFRTLDSLQQLSTDYVPAVYDTILLDTIEAAWQGDYRKAILYSAISMETFVATLLDNTYNSILSNGDTDGVLRLVSINHSGKPILKDPIYEYISRGTDFGRLLHERPLYLLGRSLLVGDQKLYQKAKKLYTTRNRIAHRGEPSDNDETLPLDYNGSQEAIECVMQVLRWFDSTNNYIASEIMSFVETPLPEQVT